MSLIWGSSSHGWALDVPGGPGRAWRVFGLVPYLRIESDPVTFSGTRLPGFRRSWTWYEGGLVTAVTMSLAVSAAGLALLSWNVRRDALTGRCDECGYDLRATTGPRCPECGASVAGRR